MSKIHGKGSVIFYDEFNLSSFFNQIEVNQEVSTAETTCFGATGSARTFVAGHRNGTVSLSGYFDGDAGAVDETLAADIAAATKRVLTTGFEAAAVNGIAKLANPDTTNYSVSSPMDGAVATSAAFQASGGIDTGRFLTALAAVTATGDGTSVDGAAATTTGWVAHQHITAASGTTPTNDTKLQDSADNSAWADVTGGAFSQKTAAGTERIAGAAGATLRRYVRESHTLGGTNPSFTQVIAVARRPVA